MIVAIDDERDHDGWDIVLTNSTDALAFLVRHIVNYNFSQCPLIEQLWLDHDLGEDDDAMVIARYLRIIGYSGVKDGIGQVLVHSQNPVGAANIVNLLNEHVDFNAYQVPLPEGIRLRVKSDGE